MIEHHYICTPNRVSQFISLLAIVFWNNWTMFSLSCFAEVERFVRGTQYTMKFTYVELCYSETTNHCWYKAQWRKISNKLAENRNREIIIKQPIKDNPKHSVSKHMYNVTQLIPVFHALWVCYIFIDKIQMWVHFYTQLFNWRNVVVFASKNTIFKCFRNTWRLGLCLIRFIKTVKTNYPIS